MTDRELKKHLKKLSISIILVALVMIMLSVYTLGSTKAQFSIYNSSKYTNNLQALGIEEEEFKKYLSMFGNLVNDKYDENETILNTASYFMDNMYSAYEIKINEVGMKYYDANIINEVVKEINGTYVKENIDGGQTYTYNIENNIYTQNQTQTEIPYCIEITEISKNGEQIEVTYKLAMLTNEQMAEYMTGKKVDFETKTVKAIILNNTDYEYSKYFVSSIEEK